MKILSATKLAMSASLLGCVALGLAPTRANAATAVTTFGVSATVVATCLVSATALGFGPYTGVVDPATSTITVTCTNTTPYSVGLDAGTGTAATVTARTMKSGALVPELGYGLFQDASHVTNWGLTGAAAVAGVGTGAAQPIIVYGQIPAAEYVSPGAYTDTITATVTY